MEVLESPASLYPAVVHQLGVKVKKLLHFSKCSEVIVVEDDQAARAGLDPLYVLKIIPNSGPRSDEDFVETMTITTALRDLHPVYNTFPTRLMI